MLLLHFDVPHFVFNTQQTQVQGKQQVQVFMWFLQSLDTIYLISEGWPHNPTDSHGTIGRYEKDFNEAQWDWVVDATGYKQSDWSTMWVWKGCGFSQQHIYLLLRGEAKNRSLNVPSCPVSDRKCCHVLNIRYSLRGVSALAPVKTSIIELLILRNWMWYVSLFAKANSSLGKTPFLSRYSIFWDKLHFFQVVPAIYAENLCLDMSPIFGQLFNCRSCLTPIIDFWPQLPGFFDIHSKRKQLGIAGVRGTTDCQRSWICQCDWTGLKAQPIRISYTMNYIKHKVDGQHYTVQPNYNILYPFETMVHGATCLTVL